MATSKPKTVVVHIHTENEDGSKSHLWTEPLDAAAIWLNEETERSHFLVGSEPEFEPEPYYSRPRYAIERKDFFTLKMSLRAHRDNESSVVYTVQHTDAPENVMVMHAKYDGTVAIMQGTTEKEAAEIAHFNPHTNLFLVELP